MTRLKPIDQPQDQNSSLDQPSREEAEKAVETLLRYIGEDPSRPGLVDTPARYVRAFDEFFDGYKADPAAELSRTFEDIEHYDDMVIVRGIDFVSHCEHHIVPILGQAHVAYWPGEKVVGLSKLARLVDIYAKRLISQENMTTNIAGVIEEVLAPKGVAVMIEADHYCMSRRGTAKANSSTVTTCFRGIFRDDATMRDRFLALVKH